MSQKSWQLDRRTMLRGGGLALGLPFLESMAVAGKPPAGELPRRMCCIFFPFGVAMPAEDAEDRQWGWFPTGAGREFELTNPLKPLEPFRDQLTVLGGLSHPNGRGMGGHDTGDTFLTGSDLSGNRLTNSVSIDQFAATRMMNPTRFESLTLSCDGGVGQPTRSTTLSFSEDGRPIPALASPQQIFDRLFGREEDVESRSARQRLETSSSMLDLVLEHSNSLRNQLGSYDRQKLDDYLSSVRALERRVEQSQKWVDVPKPHVDPDFVDRSVDQESPQEYLRAMYDLLYLAFQTDSTRLATFMLGQVAGATTIANAFPACIGLEGNWHGLAHGAGKKGGKEKLGRFDMFLAEQLAHFVGRLAETEEGEARLLDRTMVFYGSSNSRTHHNYNYPLLLVGGSGLGLMHGQYLTFGDETPLSNLFVTLLDRLNVPVESFSDSTGELTGITL